MEGKIALVLSTMVTIVLVACASGPSSDGEDGTSTVKNGKTTESSPATPSGAPAPSASSARPAPAPAAAPTGTKPAAPDDARKACVEKCSSESPEGAEEFGAILVPCACEADACKDACSACAAAPAAKDLLGGTDACRACVAKTLEQGGKCSTKLFAECPAKASCPVFGLCARGCQ